MREITTINGVYIVHFMDLLTEEETEKAQKDINRINKLFTLAKNKAHDLDGYEYRGKQYGGGIAFKSRGQAEKAIKLLSNERTSNAISLILRAKECFRKSATAGVSYCNTGWEKKREKELSYAHEGEEILKAVFPDIKIDYPGLYPSFEINGHHHYSIDGLIRHEVETLI